MATLRAIVATMKNLEIENFMVSAYYPSGKDGFEYTKIPGNYITLLKTPQGRGLR